jgi:hypothetical protein
MVAVRIEVLMIVLAVLFGRMDEMNETEGSPILDISGLRKPGHDEYTAVL